MSDQTFPRSRRLLSPREFRQVFDRGRSSSDKRLIVYAKPTPEGIPTRLGLVVSRKFGDSHLRNDWKRKVREAFRTLRGELPAAHDLVVLPTRKGAGSVAEFAAICESLLRVAAAAAREFAERGPR